LAPKGPNYRLSPCRRRRASSCFFRNVSSSRLGFPYGPPSCSDLSWRSLRRSPSSVGSVAVSSSVGRRFLSMAPALATSETGSSLCLRSPAFPRRRRAACGGATLLASCTPLPGRRRVFRPHLLRPAPGQPPEDPDRDHQRDRDGDDRRVGDQADDQQDYSHNAENGQEPRSVHGYLAAYPASRS
jgi:hypothetical protein